MNNLEWWLILALRATLCVFTIVTKIIVINNRIGLQKLNLENC